MLNFLVRGKWEDEMIWMIKFSSSWVEELKHLPWSKSQPNEFILLSVLCHKHLFRKKINLITVTKQKDGHFAFFGLREKLLLEHPANTTKLQSLVWNRGDIHMLWWLHFHEIKNLTGPPLLGTSHPAKNKRLAWDTWGLLNLVADSIVIFWCSETGHCELVTNAGSLGDCLVD